MLKIHINKLVKGENSQKAKRGQKRTITQLRKKVHQIYQQKKAKKKKKLRLPIPSKTAMKQNQQHIKHTIIQRSGVHTAHTLTWKQNKTKTKHQKQAKLQKSKSISYLHY